jgi:hypothetical protein
MHNPRKSLNGGLRGARSGVYSALSTGQFFNLTYALRDQLTNREVLIVTWNDFGAAETCVYRAGIEAQVFSRHPQQALMSLLGLCDLWDCFLRDQSGRIWALKNA